MIPVHCQKMFSFLYIFHVFSEQKSFTMSRLIVHYSIDLEIITLLENMCRIVSRRASHHRNPYFNVVLSYFCKQKVILITKQLHTNFLLHNLCIPILVKLSALFIPFLFLISLAKTLHQMFLRALFFHPRLLRQLF